MVIKAGWSGRYFEDFEVGDVYRHPLGRTITEADNTWFTLLTLNTAQTHFNRQVGERSEFRRSLVNSTLTLAIVCGESVIDTTFNGFANLGWEDIRLTAPVFVGDTLWAETVVLRKRESASRSYAGIVGVRTRGLNQDGVDVLSYTRTFYVYKRNAAGAQSCFPEPQKPTELVDPEEAS